jgi:hypothetical protein
VSQDGPAESGSGVYLTARMRRTTSLLMGISQAKGDLLRDSWTPVIRKNAVRPRFLLILGERLPRMPAAAGRRAIAYALKA